MKTGLHDPFPEHRLSLLDIIEAAGTADPVFLHSPQYESEALSDRLGCQLTLKVETANPIRSFKGRGADYFIQKIEERGDKRQLVCASTGNFGQAMAYACRSHGRSVIVYADMNANPLKLDRIRSFGAEVRQAGDDFDAAKGVARGFCRETEAWMIEDGREPEISEGAGTIAVELLQESTFDTFIVPLGNGALINGVGRWVKAAAPETTIIGVSASGADAMERSWRTTQVVQRPEVATIAEGIAVRIPVPEAVEDMDPLVDDVMLVGDDQMKAAMRLLRDTSGLLAEPAAAVGVAALMTAESRFRDLRVATIITGSNVSPEQWANWLG